MGIMIEVVSNPLPGMCGVWVCLYLLRDKVGWLWWCTRVGGGALGLLQIIECKVPSSLIIGVVGWIFIGCPGGY